MNKLYDGVYLFTDSLSEEEKLYLAGLYIKNDFYIPKLKTGHSMKLEMCCFGKHWNPVDYKYYSDRIDLDGKRVASIPTQLITIAAKFTQQSFPSFTADWDVCIANYYQKGSSLGLHQDNSESLESLKLGHPVVSFSIGAEAIFDIGGVNRKDPVAKISLKNGDVLIFGGVSRLRYHGISKVLDNSPYMSLPGRLNFTLRKY